MAGPDAAAEAVRKEAREILKLYGGGRREEAIALAEELAAAHPDSALALNFAGDLHHHNGKAASQRGGPRSGMERHFRSALAFRSEAARLAPACISTAVMLADDLALNVRYSDAERELSRALEIRFPDDPAKNSMFFEIRKAAASNSSARKRKLDAMDRARKSMDYLIHFICTEVVPANSMAVLQDNELGGPAAAEARELAKDLAVNYPFSARARLLRAYVDLTQIRRFDPAIDKRRFLRRTLGMVAEAAEDFGSSLVVALFHAKLLFILGERDAAERECLRALGVKKPDDPTWQDIPLNSVEGAVYDERVSSVKNQLRILLKKLVIEAETYWRSMTSEKQGSILSVRVDELHEHYKKTDQSAAKTISDAQCFVNRNKSWSFWICPNSHCDGVEFVDTDSLWSHISTKHQGKLWKKLQLSLYPKLCENRSMGGNSLDEITLCQDSGQHDIFRLINIDGIFSSLLIQLPNGIEAEPFAKMRKRKCKEGNEILDGIKEKLKNLPADIASIEFDEARSSIQGLWLKLLKVSCLDYREIILSLVRSFQWREIKKCMTEDGKIAARIIDAANIDAIFFDDTNAPDINVSAQHDSKPSHENKMDHNCGGNQQEEKLKLSCSDPTLKAVEVCEESKVDSRDRKSGTMMNQQLSGLPIHMNENRMKQAAELVNVELDTQETLNQSSEEVPIASYERNIDVLNKLNADEGLFILYVIIQSLWNLKLFRERILMGTPVWILPIHDTSCIAEVLYAIFSSWERNEHHQMAALLTSVKTILWKNINDSDMFQKVEKKIASELVATLLMQMHMSEACLHFTFDTEIKGRVVYPITRGDCICRIHELFGIKFHVQVNCRCGKCFDETEHTTLIYKLDAGSPETTKIKPFEALPVLLDEQLFCKDSCEHCGTPKNADLFLSKAPHFFTLGVAVLCPDGCESQFMFSEVLADVTSPLNVKISYEDVYSTSSYAMASMICYADGRYVCIARDQDKWLINDSRTVDVENTWERLLERFRNGKLQPEVLFFEVIK